MRASRPLNCHVRRRIDAAAHSIVRSARSRTGCGIRATLAAVCASAASGAVSAPASGDGPSPLLPQSFQCRPEQRANGRIARPPGLGLPLSADRRTAPGRARHPLPPDQWPAAPPTKRTCGFYGHFGPGARGHVGLEAQRVSEAVRRPHRARPASGSGRRAPRPAPRDRALGGPGRCAPSRARAASAPP